MARPRGDIAPRLLRAARQRFLSEGVDGASLRAIAKDAGTTIGMVYYYFPTKDELFIAVVEEVYDALLRDLAAAVDETLPVRERLSRLYGRLGALSADERAVVRLVVREMLTSPERLSRLIARFQRGHVPLLVGLVRDGFAAGLFDPAIPAPIVLAGVAALAGPAQLLLNVALPLLPALGLAAPEGASEALVDLLLHGAGRPPGGRPGRG